jgi:hypothetical protein
VTRRAHDRHKLVLLVVAVLGLAIAPAVEAGVLFGVALGPKAVRTGEKVTYTGNGLLASKRFAVTVQPSFCVGSNGCGAGVKGRWKSDSSGHVTVRFSFPRRYGFGCTAVGCASHPRFTAGKHAQVQICVIEPTEDGESGYLCDVRTVRVVRHANTSRQS